MKIKISLTSLGFKLLSLFLTLIFIGLTCALMLFYTHVPWFAIVFSILILAFCSFSCFLCFNHCVIVNTKSNLLFIKSLKTIKINISEISQIKIDTKNSIDDRKYCFIEVILKDGTIYKTSEYSTLKKNNAVQLTKRKIDELNDILKLHS